MSCPVYQGRIQDFLKIPHENEIIWIQKGGGTGEGASKPYEPPLDPPLTVYQGSPKPCGMHKVIIE